MKFDGLKRCSSVSYYGKIWLKTRWISMFLYSRFITSLRGHVNSVYQVINILMNGPTSINLSLLYSVNWLVGSKKLLFCFFHKIAWSADSRLICSGSADSTLKVSVQCLIFLLYFHFYLTFLKWLLIEICVTFHGQVILDCRFGTWRARNFWRIFQAMLMRFESRLMLY